MPERRLTIVQNRPTQFDMPLHNMMQRSGDWALQVIYTDASDPKTCDAETGHAPIWDHVSRDDEMAVYLPRQAQQDQRLVADRIAAHEPDLAVLCGYFPRLHARLVGPLKNRGIKIGLRSDNTLPHGNFGGLKGVAKKAILPYWLSRYDTWHPVGMLAAEYLKNLAWKERPVYPFPYAIDVDWFNHAAQQVREQKSEYRKKWELAENDFVVLGIMKWHAREDPITLLKGFEVFAGQHPSARLLLVGDGPLKNEVHHWVKKLAPKVITPGYLPYSSLPEIYAISDVFVHPSIDEPWGVSVQEALACGLQVIVAEGVGSATDLFGGEVGKLFGNGDASQLAGLLTDCATDSSFSSGAALARARTLDYGYSVLQFAHAVDRVLHD